MEEGRASYAPFFSFLFLFFCVQLVSTNHGAREGGWSAAAVLRRGGRREGRRERRRGEG